jgi:hypothetical protein
MNGVGDEDTIIAALAKLQHSAGVGHCKDTRALRKALHIVTSLLII